MKKKREGFTLVELLLTLAVVVVGLTSVIGMVLASANQSREQRDHLLADHFASSVLATLRGAARDVHDTEFLDMSFPLTLTEETVVLRADGVRRAWPGRFADGRVPRLEYILDMQASDETPRGVDVSLWVKPLDGDALAREYEWLLVPGGAAW